MEKNVAFFTRTEKNRTFRTEKNTVPNPVFLYAVAWPRNYYSRFSAISRKCPQIFVIILQNFVFCEKFGGGPNSF